MPTLLGAKQQALSIPVRHALRREHARARAEAIEAVTADADAAETSERRVARPVHRHRPDRGSVACVRADRTRVRARG